ncbi:unnamed protein product [Musa hybrid cultivar]
MHSMAWRVVVMVAALLQICSSRRELESNLSHPNRIIKLPGQPQVSFQQFSSYVIMDEPKSFLLLSRSRDWIRPQSLWFSS